MPSKSNLKLPLSSPHLSSYKTILKQLG